jgi:hypothetical protein
MGVVFHCPQRTVAPSMNLAGGVWIEKLKTNNNVAIRSVASYYIRLDP